MRLHPFVASCIMFMAFVGVAPNGVAAAPTKKGEPRHKSTRHKAKNTEARATTRVIQGSTQARFRGWDYLVSRLAENGVAERELVAIYGDRRMPERTFVPFSINPREPASIYESFKRPEHAATGASFIQRNSAAFDHAEATLKVPKEVIAAIIVVESQAGKNTGRHPVLYRLSRLATTNAPDNVLHNYVLQKRKDPRITLADVRRRGRYLERTFLPEIPALIAIAKRNNVDVLSITGSSAGALGLPQFLPSALLRYGMDGNKDGAISLHDEHDAILSAANYLSNFGFKKDIPLQEKRAIIWRYNKSKSYIDTVLSLSESIKDRVK